MDRPRLAWRRRLTAYLDQPWPVIAAQPVLYLFMWIAAIHVAATSGNRSIGLEATGLSADWYLAWNVLALGGPMMVAAAWWLIRHGSGKRRVWGFWLRAGGDVAALAAIGTYIAARLILLHNNIADSPLFALITLTGVAVLVFLWVVRDTAALILLERMATQLHTLEDDP